MSKLYNKFVEWFQSGVEKSEAEKQRIIAHMKQQEMSDRYMQIYCMFAEDVVNVLEQVQRKHHCLLQADIMTVGQVRGVSNDNRCLDFHIPYAYKVDEKTRKDIERMVSRGMLGAIGKHFPEYRNINVFADKVMSIQRASYGFRLVAKNPFV